MRTLLIWLWFSGEFCVDLDDEAEGKAWISSDQPWRLLEPCFVDVLDESISTCPALASARAPAITTSELCPPALAHHTVPASLEQESWSQILICEFTQLYRKTVDNDEHGVELPQDTRARFELLHARCATI